MNNPATCFENQAEQNGTQQADVHATKMHIRTEQSNVVQEYISFCQVIRTKKKGFINLAVRDEDQGPRILRELMTALDRAGKRQWDPAPGRPIVRDIKDAVAKARN